MSGEPRSESLSADQNSEVALKRILGAPDLPTIPENFPPSINLSLAELGGKEGLPTVTENALRDHHERAQFISINPGQARVDKSAVYGEGDKTHVGTKFVADAMKSAKNQDVPLLAYHVDGTVPNKPISLFSITDIATYAANPEMARIFAVSGRYGIEALIQVPQPKRNFIQRKLYARRVRRFLRDNGYYRMSNRYEQAQLLQRLGLRYYHHYTEDPITTKNPPLGGIQLTIPKQPSTISHQ